MTTPPKPPIPAPCVPVAAPEQDLAVQSTLFFKLGAVAKAAEALHAGHVRDLPAYQMLWLWLKLEDALNEWRAGQP